MNFQDASNLRIPEGYVRTIHDKDSRLLWGSVGYDVSFDGNATQTGTPTPDSPLPISVVTGENFVKVVGKNLFDKDNAPIAHLLIGTTSLTATSSGGATYIPVVGGQTYTFSRQNTTDQASDSAYCFTSELPAGEVPTIGRTVFGNNLTFTATAPENAKYLVIYFAWAKSDATIRSIFDTFQIELGSTATSYEPYQGQEFPIDLGSIELAKIGTYQDRIYKTGGKWYVEKQVGKVVLNGTQTYMSYSNGAFTYYNFAGDGYPKPMQENSYGSSANILVISDHYTGQKTDYRGSCQENHIIKVTGSNDQIAWKDTRYTNPADMISWLASNPTTVYYALATPTTTEITNEEVLEGLEAIGDATLYVGANNIYTDTPSALPTLEVDYPTGYDEEHDTVAIDSQARTITLNGADIYHLKTEESEFQVLAPGENRMYLTSATTSDTGYAEVKFKQGYLSI